MPAAPQYPIGATRTTADIQIAPGCGPDGTLGPQTASGFFNIDGPVAVPAAWQASHVYAVGALITDSNGNVQACTENGTSGSSAPSWSEELGAATSDNSTAWENAGTSLAALVPGPCTIIVVQ
ncbi:MAG TPA: hypothetical protein VIX83_07895 [Candidatus Cybelea sp.]